MNTIFLRRVNLGNDSQVKEIGDQKVVEFSVAENRRYKNEKGEPREIVTWYKVSYWTNRTDISEYLKKGACVNVIGKLVASAYINKSNVPVADLRVTANEIDLLTKREEDEQPEPQHEESDVF